MSQEQRRIDHMEGLRKQIADRIREGASLSSPQVVELSHRLDLLVLEAYRVTQQLPAL